jgi:phosphate butyryltransferase
MAPAHISSDHRYTDLSQVHQWTHQQFLKRTKVTPDRPCRIVIAPAQDGPFLQGMALAYDRGFVEPILVGNERRIRTVIDDAGIPTTSDWRIIHEPDPLAAVARAASLIKKDEADTLMRGRILVYDFFKVLFHPEHGLRDKRQFWSQIGILQIPNFPRLLIVSDCGLNVTPDIHQKVRIIENAISLAGTLGITRPKVALLAAVEAVYLKMPVLVEESILAHFSARGGFKDAVVDGPLSLDLAISPEAAEKKKMTGEVAGKADILIVNNIYVGNSLYKALVTLGKAESASVALGGNVPVVLPSRSESPQNILHSLALAAGLWAQRSSSAGQKGSDL